MPKRASVPKIKYIVSDQTTIDQIQTLWEELNLLMGKHSTHFKPHFETMTWEKRRSELLNKAACNRLRIDIALDVAANTAVGYLVSSLNSEGFGIVESIFISEEYRCLGIGKSLMSRALAWMDQNGAIEKVLEVTVGNEQVYDFYARFGFMPRQTLLKQVKK